MTCLLDDIVQLHFDRLKFLLDKRVPYSSGRLDTNARDMSCRFPEMFDERDPAIVPAECQVPVRM